MTSRNREITRSVDDQDRVEYEIKANGWTVVIRMSSIRDSDAVALAPWFEQENLAQKIADACNETEHPPQRRGAMITAPVAEANHCEEWITPSISKTSISTHARVMTEVPKPEMAKDIMKLPCSPVHLLHALHESAAEHLKSAGYHQPQHGGRKQNPLKRWHDKRTFTMDPR